MVHMHIPTYPSLEVNPEQDLTPSPHSNPDPGEGKNTPRNLDWFPAKSEFTPTCRRAQFRLKFCCCIDVVSLLLSLLVVVMFLLSLLLLPMRV